MANKLAKVSSNKIFGGIQKVISHKSKELGCKMNIAVFLPKECAENNTRLPVLYWLSGLTCTEANFIEKSGAQKFAAQEGIIIVCPDTSPRGLNLPNDSSSWDFGVGASFYLNAVQDPWKNNYKMYNYVINELITLINANFPTLEGKQSVCGHSVGGHGALICTLKNPGLFKSVSTFSAMSNPSECPWGQKAFNGYLGPRENGLWKDWDATELIKIYKGPPIEIFMDQGTDDYFYKNKQLLPENFIAACKEVGVPVTLKWREGYDHSYYFIATFIEEHIQYHAKFLKA